MKYCQRCTTRNGQPGGGGHRGERHTVSLRDPQAPLHTQSTSSRGPDGEESCRHIAHGELPTEDAPREDTGETDIALDPAVVDGVAYFSVEATSRTDAADTARPFALLPAAWPPPGAAGVA